MHSARFVFDLDDENFTGRCRAGVVRFGKSISTASIRDVGLGQMTSPRSLVPQTATTERSEKTGMVYSSEFNMPVTLPGNRQLSEDVTGLIRYQLDRMGHSFPQ